MAEYYYRGYGGCECVCDLEIDQINNIIVFTERGDNEGTSVTNMIEELANMVVDNFQLDRGTLTCFEIYNSASYKGQKDHNYINISLVQFEQKDWRFSRPRWAFYEKDEFLDFLRLANSSLIEYFK